MKTIVTIVVYNRYENLKRWLYCWKQCDQADSELIVIHTGDEVETFKAICEENNIQYIHRKNIGFDIGCFQDVCKQRLKGFPNNWDYILWCTDDTLPMSKDFVQRFVEKMKQGVGLSCMQISKSKPGGIIHVRTTGFCISKETSKKITFPADPITTKAQCYYFEHRGGKDTLCNQVRNMGLDCVQVDAAANSPLWDTGYWKRLNRQSEHSKTFFKPVDKICIVTTFDRNYKEAGKTLFNSIRRHTDCDKIDFKIITADADVLNEFGKENCYFVTDDIKSTYSNVKYSSDLPVEKYAASWYRFEIFNMTKYNRVICIDSDCICVKDISYLFSEELNDYDLISVEDHIVSKCFSKLVPELERKGLRLSNLSDRIKEGKIDIQPALLVANKTIIKETWYRKLLNYANTAPFSYSIDEGVLNDFIYMEGLRIKLLPLEWDYQDIYEQVCPNLPVPSDPVIVHCQESKPFKKSKANIDKRMHKWHDIWWMESKPILSKTLVVIIVWNRFENLKRWVDCWNQCEKEGAEMIVIHNQESDNHKYWKLCNDNAIVYVSRENAGFDIGAFQDVCKERLPNFPNDWDNLIWITDDCIPMSKNFVGQYLECLSGVNIPCYEISNEVKTHVRTTGFLITKELSKRLIFPKDPIYNREDCYQFEHKGMNMYNQLVDMGKKPVMVVGDLKLSPLWDFGVRGNLNLMKKHEDVFKPVKSNTPIVVVDSDLDRLAIMHKSDKSSLYHNYAVKYDKILSSFRESFSSVLEIGVAQGQSIRVWADYFPKAIIHGADISKASEVCKSYSNRIKFHLLDQRDAVQLKNLEQFSPFDLIIDDGNHFWSEQILTFKTIFPYLRSGGIYIVEDTTTSYWKEYKNNPVSPVEFFKTLVDDVHLNGAKGNVPANPPNEFNDWTKGWHRREDCYESLPLFDSIQFMNGFIVIYRR